MRRSPSLQYAREAGLAQRLIVVRVHEFSVAKEHFVVNRAKNARQTSRHWCWSIDWLLLHLILWFWLGFLRWRLHIGVFGVRLSQFWLLHDGCLAFIYRIRQEKQHNHRVNRLMMRLADAWFYFDQTSRFLCFDHAEKFTRAKQSALFLTEYHRQMTNLSWIKNDSIEHVACFDQNGYLIVTFSYVICESSPGFDTSTQTHMPFVTSRSQEGDFVYRITN